MKKKPKEVKTDPRITVAVRLDNDVLSFYTAVAKMAKIDFSDVMNVILAVYIMQQQLGKGELQK